MGNKVEFLKKTFSRIPDGKTVKSALFDSEFYTAEVINFLESKGCIWAIAASQDVAVKAAINEIKCWGPLFDNDGFNTGRDVGETIHCMEKTNKSFRLVVIRWKNKDNELCYHVIATNNSEDSANKVVLSYNQRADMENPIKEVKSGFGMDKMPSGDFLANALYFAIGILVHNLFIAQKVFVFPSEFRKKTIESIRWAIVEVPGKLVKHANNTILKISATIEKFNILTIMRRNMECIGFL